MAVTLQAKRIRGDQFTAEDLLETKFTYTDIGTMYEALTTIEVVSGVDVEHGGGAEADSYLHYKSVEDDGDENGYIEGCHKNHIANLLCVRDSCHDKLHNSKKGYEWKKTSDGYQLQELL